MRHRLLHLVATATLVVLMTCAGAPPALAQPPAAAAQAGAPAGPELGFAPWGELWRYLVSLLPGAGVSRPRQAPAPSAVPKAQASSLQGAAPGGSSSGGTAQGDNGAIPDPNG